MRLDTWAEAFAFTQLCELPVWTLAFKRAGDAESWLEAAVLAFAASAITHPVVWFVFPLLPVPYWWMVAAAETFAVGVEAIYAWRFRVKRALLWSFAANALSAGLGLWLRTWSW
jgi:hypothetical protein